MWSRRALREKAVFKRASSSLENSSMNRCHVEPCCHFEAQYPIHRYRPRVARKMFQGWWLSVPFWMPWRNAKLWSSETALHKTLAGRYVICVNLAPQLTKDISARKLGVDENEVTAWNMFVIRDLSRPLSHLKVTKVPLNKHNFFRTSIENLSLQCHYTSNLTRKGNWCAPLLLRYDENRWSDMSSAESSDRRGIL